ncbi:ribonuclease H-like domain-containing protein [Tanacetum coccineum]
MDLETAQTTTTVKLPILKQGEYDMWRLRIEQYFQVQDYALWDVIKNENSFKPTAQTTTNADGTSTTLIPGPVTTEAKVQKKNDVKARSMLLMALPNEHLMTFNQYKNAQTLFVAKQTRFGGNEATKKTQKTLLKQIHENFSENISQEDLNLKFLRSLSSEWNTHVVVWRNKPDLDTMSFDDLYNNFKIVEQEVKGTTSSSSSSQNMAFVSSPSSTNEVNTANKVSTANTQVSPASTQVSTASTQVSTANLSDDNADCNYHQRERVVFGKKAHPSAHRNMVPRAVLMKTGLRSLNTARPVNTAHPKTTVYSARPMQKVVNTLGPNSAVVNAMRENPRVIHKRRSRLKVKGEAHGTNESVHVPISQTSRNLMEDMLPLGEELKEGKLPIYLGFLFGILKSFITEIENLVDNKVKIIRCDNGIEFKNRVMSEFCENKGIKIEFSIARTPQQNGVAERINRKLIEAARTMLADSKLPTTFWAEVVNTDGKVKIVTEASVKRHLQLADFDGISFFPTTEIFEQLSLMRYPAQTPVVDEAASTGVDVRYGEATTTDTIFEVGQGSELMIFYKTLSKKVESLEINLKQTKLTYGAAYTKLIKKVKKLENKVKSSQARRRAKIIVSDDEDDLEDPSKRGWKIAKIDQDPAISLVQHDAEIQGRHEHDMEFDLILMRTRMLVLAERMLVLTSLTQFSRLVQQLLLLVLLLVLPKTKVKLKWINLNLKLHRLKQSCSKNKKDLVMKQLLDYKLKLRKKRGRGLPEYMKELALLMLKNGKTYKLEAYQSEKKHMGGYTLQQLKGYSLDEIKNLFETTMRRVHTFVPIESEIERAILELAARSSKRDAKEELDQESSKRQNIGESSKPAKEPKDKEEELSQEELQQMTNNSSDGEECSERSTEPTNDKEREIWVELKRLFEPNIDDELWKLQKHIHDLTWKLYDSCGVHHVSTVKGIGIYMLVEKEYPLSRGTLT